MKPKRIILVRHGQSQGNADREVYKKTPSYALKLTEKGREQAIEAGNNIKTIINNGPMAIYYSPFFRAHETMDFAFKSLKDNPIYFNREEVRLREQERGSGVRGEFDDFNVDGEMEKYGTFYYRITRGESCADVFDRMSDFLGTMHRDFEKPDFPENVLIFGHGMGNRLFIMRFFHHTVEEFETWGNPKNGELYVMELQENGKYKLLTELRKHEVKHQYKYKI